MASKRRIRNHECTRKTRYATEAKARFVAWRSRVRTGDHIREYRCCHCNGWHIGHRSAKKVYQRTDNE